MAYASLYRKYRPASFDEVIGQDAVVRTLRNMVTTGNIAHAYLFTGTRGTGKTSVARIFARAVNCAHPLDGSPCGQCEACRSLASTSNVDFFELDAASNNSVEDIRALRDSVQYPPADSAVRYKVYIIDEVHQLSSQAFNAFLKTLEEPPAYCLFILATTEVHKLPQTILSRCLRFDFRQVSQDDLAAHVGRIFDREGVQYEKEALWAIASAGAGSVRDTLSVADTCMSAADGVLTYAKVLSVLGANDPSLIADIASAVLRGDLAKALAAVERSVSMGKSVAVLTKDIAKYIRDLLIIKADPAANDYLKLPADRFAAAQAIATGADNVMLVRALDAFSALDGNMRLASSPRTVLENAIAHTATYCGLQLTDLAARIGGVERQLEDCKRKIEEGVKVQVTAMPAGAAVASPAAAPTEEPASDEVDLTEGLEAVDDPFGDAPSAKESEIRTEPSDYMSAKALAVKYRGSLLGLLRERKYLVLQSIMDDVYVTIKDSDIIYNIKETNDVQYCEKSRELLESLTRAIFGDKPYKLVFKFAPPKQKDGDDFAGLMQIVGANKVTKK